MTEFESLLREIAKVDREMTAHLNANPDTALEKLSTGVREEWNEIVRRKYMALDAIAALAVAKYKHEQL